MESYNFKKLEDQGIRYHFVQDNHAYSTTKGVIRGLHFQKPPMAQTKLVRVTRGGVLDVVVDIRKGSPTFGKSFSIELSAENYKQLLVPAGFAHGYSTLTEEVEFLYKVDEYYSPENDAGILWNDPALGIDWMVDSPTLSPKDEKLPLFSEIDSPFVFEAQAAPAS